MRIALLSLFALISFSACKKTTVVNQTVNQAFSAVYIIAASSWSTSDGGLSYSATLTVKELDNVINENGGVIVYLSFAQNPTTYEAIPEVFDGISYGSIHTTGSVTIDLHAVDGSVVTPPAGPIQAKVVLIDAQALGN